jgi:hypothetical protein
MFNLQSSIFNVDIHAYPDVMTLVATVDADEQVSLEGIYYVGAFYGDECRGVGVLEDGLLYMNIHGEESSPSKLEGVSQSDGGVCEIVFRLLDANGEVYNSLGNVVFQSCRQLGTVQHPYRLFFASQDILDEIKPAVATPGTIRSIQYYDLSGRLISSKVLPHGGAERGLGFCIRKVIYEDGSVKVSKVYY